MFIREVRNSLPFLICFFSLLISIYMYHTKAVTKVVVIAVDSNQTRLLTTGDKDLREQEKVNFIRSWVDVYFNFNGANFKKRIGEGSGYLSKRLWVEQEYKVYKELAEKSKNLEFKEASILEAVRYMEEDDTWSLTLDVEFEANGKLTKKEVIVAIKLISVERSIDNKWGLLIDELSKKY